MGAINLNDSDKKDRLKFQTGIIKKKGFCLNKKDTWEVHKPQQEMDYQV